MSRKKSHDSPERSPEDAGSEDAAEGLAVVAVVAGHGLLLKCP